MSLGKLAHEFLPRIIRRTAASWELWKISNKLQTKLTTPITPIVSDPLAQRAAVELRARPSRRPRIALTDAKRIESQMFANASLGGLPLEIKETIGNLLERPLQSGQTRRDRVVDIINLRAT